MNQRSLPFRLAQLLCLVAALWFVLGGSLKLLAAHASGRTIEMVVCSGAGIKKIYLDTSSSSSASDEVSLKHCGNTPLALPTVQIDILGHLAYAAPITQVIWHRRDEWRIDINTRRNGMPPPGRAPPHPA